MSLCSKWFKWYLPKYFDSDSWVLIGPVSATYLLLCFPWTPIIFWVLHQEPKDSSINGHKQNLDWTGHWGTTHGLPSFFLFLWMLLLTIGHSAEKMVLGQQKFSTQSRLWLQWHSRLRPETMMVIGTGWQWEECGVWVCKCVHLNGVSVCVI